MGASHPGQNIVAGMLAGALRGDPERHAAPPHRVDHLRVFDQREASAGLGVADAVGHDSVMARIAPVTIE